MGFLTLLRDAADEYQRERATLVDELHQLRKRLGVLEERVAVLESPPGDPEPEPETPAADQLWGSHPEVYVTPAGLIWHQADEKNLVAFREPPIPTPDFGSIRATMRLPVNGSGDGIGLVFNAKAGGDRGYTFLRIRQWSVEPSLKVSNWGFSAEGSTDLGFIPVRGQWFTIRADLHRDSEGLWIKARAWNTSEVEPEGVWPAVCLIPDPPTGGEIGLWSM